MSKKSPGVRLARYACLLLTFLLSLLCAAQEVTAPAPVLLVPEVVKTPEGNFFVYHRAPAGEDDLGMPIVQSLAVVDTLVYRIRDRKRRDLLFFARHTISSVLTPEAARLYYLNALGEGATESRDEVSGEITLAAGEADHLRLVVITPQDGGCRLRLQRVQKFTIPPRVYTAQEAQIVALLAEVVAGYRAQAEIRYTVEQRVILPDDAPADERADPLFWHIHFVLPAQLTLSAGVGDTIGLRISTKEGQLHVEQQTGETETRDIGEQLTLETLPELADDPVSGMVLGNSLINHLLEEMYMETVTPPGKGQQAKITLQYPDTGEVLTLFIDLQTKRVLHCATVTTTDGHVSTVTRDYGQYQVGAVGPPVR